MADEPWQAAHARMRHVIITLARRTDLLSDLLCVVISRRVHGWSYSPKSQPAAHVVGAGAGKLYSFGILQWKSDGFSAFSTQPYDSAFFVCFQALNILFSPSPFVFICLCLKNFFLIVICTDIWAYTGGNMYVARNLLWNLSIAAMGTTY